MVFFDLPVGSFSERKAATQFRRFLMKNGFIMNQYSVYSKFALNASQADLIKASVRKHIPANGNVQLLQVTERQFSDIEFLVGEQCNKIVSSSDRWVVIE